MRFRAVNQNDANITFDVDAPTLEQALGEILDELGWSVTVEDDDDRLSYNNESPYGNNDHEDDAN